MTTPQSLFVGLMAGVVFCAAAEASAVPEVPRWEMHEFCLRGHTTSENPFLDAALMGEFTSPSRAKRTGLC